MLYACVYFYMSLVRLSFKLLGQEWNKNNKTILALRDLHTIISICPYILSKMQ